MKHKSDEYPFPEGIYYSKAFVVFYIKIYT